MPSFNENFLFHDIFYIFYVYFVASDAFIFSSGHRVNIVYDFPLHVRSVEQAANWRVTQPLDCKPKLNEWECFDRLSDAHKSVAGLLLIGNSTVTTHFHLPIFRTTAILQDACI